MSCEHNSDHSYDEGEISISELRNTKPLPNSDLSDEGEIKGEVCAVGGSSEQPPPQKKHVFHRRVAYQPPKLHESWGSDSIWGRGLQQAKKAMEDADQRRSSETDLEEKRLRLKLRDVQYDDSQSVTSRTSSSSSSSWSLSDEAKSPPRGTISSIICKGGTSGNSRWRNRSYSRDSCSSASSVNSRKRHRTDCVRDKPTRWDAQSDSRRGRLERQLRNVEKAIAKKRSSN